MNYAKITYIVPHSVLYQGGITAPILDLVKSIVGQENGWKVNQYNSETFTASHATPGLRIEQKGIRISAVLLETQEVRLENLLTMHKTATEFHEMLNQHHGWNYNRVPVLFEFPFATPEGKRPPIDTLGGPVSSYHFLVKDFVRNYLGGADKIDIETSVLKIRPEKETPPIIRVEILWD